MTANGDAIIETKEQTSVPQKRTSIFKIPKHTPQNKPGINKSESFKVKKNRTNFNQIRIYPGVRLHKGTALHKDGKYFNVIPKLIISSVNDDGNKKITKGEDYSISMDPRNK